MKKSIELKKSPMCLLGCLAVMASGEALGQQASELDASPEPIELEVETAGDVFATRERAIVTHADLDNYIAQRVPLEHQGGFLLDPDRIGQMAENLALPRQLAIRAIDDGIDESPRVQAKMLQGLVTLLADEYVEQYFSDKELEDYEIVARELYLKSDRRSRAELDFSQILVVDDEKSSLDILRRVVTLSDRLAERPQNYDELLLENSDDPMVDSNDGRYTGVSPDSLTESVRDELLSLKPGEISEPVQSQYGWHILRLNGYKKSEQVEFEQVREEYIALAREQHRERVEGRLFSELNAVPMDFEPGAIRSLLNRYGIDFEVFERANQ